MSYQQITLAVKDTVAEPLADALMEHGALSAAIEDAYAGTENEQAIFGEPGMPTEQIWQQSKVIALFGEDDDAAAVIQNAAQECGLTDLHYTTEILEDQDWVRLTQAQFDPIQISERLWITPSWHDAPDENAVNLQLDPGLAFGTGSHPTTRLCLQWLDAQLKGGESVLDYGCGSGILAIAALKLGAGSAVGVDIDEQAIRASKANADQNNVQAQFYLPDAVPEGQFDVVVANILANPLRMLGEMLAGRTKSGGRIILSGLLDEQVEELSEIYGQWFDIEPAEIDEGWARLSGVKR
ncbi:50S ribosomal protein L11 methyltransferase [Neisseria sp. N95_16]|uniref:Ribosomal protein L11 methyltransferase n=1 Tax=Neisseria brasiliensis TaxID=2666100 RepID=A0A5Q3S0L8_9NEIS|nr:MULTISPECIES: 50S ribosomal protein L11 methyltransferase [Neisseria]MRN38508.1 50S ribosomal protein L11 methyltransferase [Neisseria brasiliensis]PJO10430.1 50S ribosomal protein L11 methyltransferase [Neisseria sp. N95_16]PJO78566.1 50S ribosomal protein L11 methyltransferase [Neisseria sp. N177_16]QGL25485.1 50S ribosomal protein L11 methyltransferase [Neisseria brasiliensis]